MYMSCVAVVEFVEALSNWVEESVLKSLQMQSYYSIMTDDCMDNTTFEELSLPYFLDYLVPFINLYPLTGCFINLCVKGLRRALNKGVHLPQLPSKPLPID